MSRRHRGVTLIELLIAALLISIVAACALSTWSVLQKVPNAKRATEMSSFIAVQAIERVKARKYENLADTNDAVSYYDKNGAPAGGVSAHGFTVRSYISTVVDRDGNSDTEDLREIRVDVFDNSGKQLETQRTLVSFGGL